MDYHNAHHNVHMAQDTVKTKIIYLHSGSLFFYLVVVSLFAASLRVPVTMKNNLE